MSSPLEALLAVNVALLGIIAAMVGYLLKQFLPVKEKVDMLWASWYGPDDTNEAGALGQFREKHDRIEDDHNTVRDMLAQARTEQRTAFSDVFQYLNLLALQLRNQDIETPDPEEKIDRDRWRNGTEEHDE